MPNRNTLNSRLATLADDRSLSDIARRTGTSVANVSRYISGTRIPGEFCSALVRGLGVNPSWLLTGEGSPFLSDVTEGTARMAGDVLELVEAMNAVTHMRLGALTGKHHLKVLRELNAALVRYEELRARLNTHSAPIFRQLVDDLGKALGKLDIERAHDLRKAASQVERLCDEPEISRRFTAQQAHCEVLDLNNDAALAYQRKLVREAVSEGRLMDEAACENFVRMALIAKDGGRLQEARRICAAAEALLDEDSAQWQSACSLRHIHGAILTDTGDLYEGLRRMQANAPLIKGRRGLASRLMLMRALMMAGLLELDEAYAYGFDAEPKALHLIEFALWTEQPEPIRKALDFFHGEVDLLPGFLETPVACEYTLMALGGDRKAAASYAQRVKDGTGRKQLGISQTITQCTLLRLTGQTTRARKIANEIEEMLPQVEPGVMMLARHYRNLLRLRLPDDDAKHFFRKMQQLGYRCFDAEPAG
ncbi:MAG: helix-turn-helix transcriptional regulator [Planctomycetota bacterium]